MIDNEETYQQTRANEKVDTVEIHHSSKRINKTPLKGRCNPFFQTQLLLKVLEFLVPQWHQMLGIASVSRSFMKLSVRLVQVHSLTNKPKRPIGNSELGSNAGLSVVMETGSAAAFLHRNLMRPIDGPLEEAKSPNQAYIQISKFCERLQMVLSEKYPPENLFWVTDVADYIALWILSRKCSVLCLKYEEESELEANFGFTLKNKVNENDLIYFTCVYQKTMPTECTDPNGFIWDTTTTSIPFFSSSPFC